MHKILIIKAFETAKLKLEQQGVKEPSLTLIAEHLSAFIEQSEGLGLNEKSYRNYNIEAKKLIETAEDISIKQLKVVNGLCKFLGYDTYEAFEFEQRDKSLKDILLFFFKKYNIVLVVGIVIITGILIYYSIHRQRWMIWLNDHYEEVKFDSEKLQEGDLKLYKKERIDHFRKVELVDCNTEFFKNDGSVNLWYGKNTDGTLELFTSTGLHPETGKTLKPITEYMINKYFCKDY